MSPRGELAAHTRTLHVGSIRGGAGSEDAREELARGFATLGVAAELSETALANLELWLANFAEYRPQLDWLIGEGRWSALLDGFYRVIPFGTGGRRGPVGIGPNRFNPVTVLSSVQGHVSYLRRTLPERELAVVIAYDVRCFHDLRGHYNPHLANPLLGLTSKDFARLAAEVYAANGVRVHMLPDDSESYISTPELSFAIRWLGADGGLNISASHNHPDDNGGKVYNSQGGQEVPPRDEEMAEEVEAVETVVSLDLAQAEALGLISGISPTLHEAYLAMSVARAANSQVRNAPVVFTPLHGTGEATVGEALRRAGFRVELVASQATFDGAFPAVPFRAPNPEVPESMQAGVELAREIGADLVVACDPDADRIGVTARSADGGFRFISGNEIAILITHYKLVLLRELGRLPTRALIITTEVTTALVRIIGEDFGAVVIDHLLVGFKNHGHVMGEIERTGRYRDVETSLEDFVLAVEESNGVLVTPEVRDKDPAGPAILIADLAARQNAQGLCLPDYLDEIYKRYGYHANLLCSMVMTAADGAADIQRIQATLRRAPPGEIAGRQVIGRVDSQDESGPRGPFLSGSDKVARNVLGFRLEGGARATLRPSGTEPKNKLYVEVRSPPLGPAADKQALERQKAEADALARQIAEDLTHRMLAIIGRDLPDYALAISGLVPLEKREAFVRSFMPGFEERARACCAGEEDGAKVSKWIDEQLVSFGADARGLVGEAVKRYLTAERADAAGGREECLAVMERIFFKSEM